MSSALDQIGRRALPTPATIGQQTAVEQARAIAEVAAAIQVARQFPRDIVRVREEMERECADYDLAREAFFAVPNRGNGPSVHLARALARIWGNFQSGVHEMSRTDVASEIQSFAWDCETNNRTSRVFVVPHQTMKTVKGEGGQPDVKLRVDIVDLQDVYANNQSVGARAVRECIFAALPKWLVNEAERLCREALVAGRKGQTIEQRRQDALDAFARGKVNKAQLEKRVGKPPDLWTPQDVAALEVLFDSLSRGVTTREEAFGEATPAVTAKEIKEQAKAAKGEAEGAKPPAGDEKTTPSAAVEQARPAPTQGHMRRIHGLLKDRDIESDEAVHNALSAILNRPITSRKQLTRADALVVIDVLDRSGPPDRTGPAQPPLADDGEQTPPPPGDGETPPKEGS